MASRITEIKEYIFENKSIFVSFIVVLFIVVLYNIYNLFVMGSSISTPRITEAVSVINTDRIKGVVIFSQKNEYVLVKVNVRGLKKNGLHGFHIHESGDLRDGCKSCCAHYNPDNKEHAGVEGGHAGDLGNLKTNDSGECKMNIRVNKFTVDDILGRSIIIHEDEDDLGLGTHEDSKTTGHSGARIACSVIGISKNGICKA